jgi:hypothetical protein
MEVRRIFAAVTPLLAVLVIAWPAAGCGSGDAAVTAASPSPSPSTPSRGERLLAEAKAYIKDLKPAMKGEAGAFNELLEAQHDFADSGTWSSAGIERMRDAQVAFAAMGRRVDKVKAPSSLRRAHRDLERYFDQTRRSFAILLEMVDQGTFDQTRFKEAQRLLTAAEQDYWSWRREAENRLVVALGKPMPIKAH